MLLKTNTYFFARDVFKLSLFFHLVIYFNRKIRKTLEKRNASAAAEKEVQRLTKELDDLNIEREKEKLSLSSTIGESEEKVRQLEENVQSLNRQIVSLRGTKDSIQRQYEDLLQEHNTFKVC